LLAAFLVSGATAFVAADEKPVEVKDLPKVVVDAVKKRFPAGEIKKAALESEDDETNYEIELVSEGKNVSVVVDDDGDVLEIETELAVADLPVAVTEAVAKKFPNTTVKSAELLIAIEDKEEERKYELQVAYADGTSFEIVAEPDGEIEEDEEWSSDFSTDKADLVSTGRNPYFILEPGYELVLEDDDERLTITVLDETKVVDGVETRVVEERETKDGKPVEVSRNYFAISKRTNNVYYFGEAVDEYKDGKVAGHGGSWLSGVNGARFGLMMPGLPLMGAKYYEEYALGRAMDRAEVVGLKEELKTPAGTFVCLEIEETTPLESDEQESKLYAPGIGLVNDGGLKLVKYGKRQGK
jgi:uncharacterized membrane protein YkoI